MTKLSPDGLRAAAVERHVQAAAAAAQTAEARLRAASESSGDSLVSLSPALGDALLLATDAGLALISFACSLLGGWGGVMMIDGPRRRRWRGLIAIVAGVAIGIGAMTVPGYGDPRAAVGWCRQVPRP